MFQLHYVTTLQILCVSFAAAGNILGYHYEKPSISLGLVANPSSLGHGHSFGALPTIQPLPPLPALPPLPTPPTTKNSYMQTQTIYQTHPVAIFNPLSNSLSSSNIGKIAQQYQSPSLQLPLIGQQSKISSKARNSVFSSAATASAGGGSNPPNPLPLAAQPLRVPFGKQALITFPSGQAGESIYEANGRALKQYAVIEIIDNDIEQSTQPSSNSPFFDSYRARVPITGAGSTPHSFGAVQLGSRSGTAFFGQQRAASPRAVSEAVALGSGGLGFIRLANGSVYLGSGSLGYVSGQQHIQEINEARTRMGASQPDALHFGHGPLGNPGRFNKFSYRF